MHVISVTTKKLVITHINHCLSIISLLHNNKICVFLERRSDAPSTLAVRRRRRRSSLCPLSTGSPFGHHPRLSMVRLRRRREWICAVAQCLQCDAAGVGVLSILFSTGSPFGHHPRLSMVRLRRRREYLCVVAAEEERR